MSLKKLVKKAEHTVTKAVQNPGNVLKKAANTAIAAGAGFLTGGPAGAVGAGTREAFIESKTGKSKPIQLRAAYQGAVAGAVTGAAVKVAGYAANAVKANGTTALSRGLGIGVQKVKDFGSSGGLVGNVGKIISGAGKLVPSLGGLGSLLQQHKTQSPLASAAPVSEGSVLDLSGDPAVNRVATEAVDSISGALRQRFASETDKVLNRGLQEARQAAGELSGVPQPTATEPGAAPDNGVGVFLAAAALVFAVA